MKGSNEMKKKTIKIEKCGGCWLLNKVNGSLEWLQNMKKPRTCKHDWAYYVTMAVSCVASSLKTEYILIN